MCTEMSQEMCSRRSFLYNDKLKISGGEFSAKFLLAAAYFDST